MAGESDSTAAQFVLREVQAFREQVRDLRVAPAASSADIRGRLASYTFAQPLPLTDALRDVAEMLRQWTLHATHPRYFGLFVPGTHEAGIWADALTALYNPQLGAWWHAPAANEIEIHTLNCLADVIGFEARAAHFTSGGGEANLTALLAAITAAYPNAVRDGVGDAAHRGAVYISSQAHHSLHKAVRVAGLGTGVLREIPCNAQHQLDVPALGEAIDRDRAAGRRPIMIVGILGTTTAGAVDDLPAVAAIARAHSAWFHVDAAWGGTAAFAPSLRPLFRGVEQADSVTWDAHKWLSVPMGAAMFFCKRADVLHATFNVDAGYVPPETDQGGDLYLTSLQWSRRFIGLKVFLTLATIGRAGIAERIDRQMAVADYLRDRLTKSGWVVVNRTTLPLVCFTHPRLTSGVSVGAVARDVVSRGRAWISAATLPEGQVLRACITHDDTSRADIDVLCEELDHSLESTPR